MMDHEMHTLDPIQPGKIHWSWDMACARASARGFPDRHIAQIHKGGTSLDPARLESWGVIRDAVINRGLVLMTGPNGVGKTHIASLLGCQWEYRGYGAAAGEARYWTAYDLLGDQMKWFGHKDDADRKPIPSPEEIARRAGLLVIDQLNELRTDTEFGRTAFVAMVNDRYATGKPTVLVTNQTAAHVFDSVLGGDMERLKEGGRVVSCKWNNYRDVIAGKGER